MRPTIFKDTGTGDIDFTVRPEKPFKLVLVRCHFTEDPDGGGASTDLAEMTIDLDSGLGYEYDNRLYALKKDGGVGLNYDAQVVVTDEAREEASVWGFSENDAIRVQWTNPGGVQWGLQVGVVFT